MKTTEKGLQKLTDAKVKEIEIAKKINEILSLKKATLSDTEGLTRDEEYGLGVAIAEKLNKLTGNERDRFLRRVELILDDDTKNQLWEGNHSQITYAISTLMQDLGRMPSKNEIAAKSELSRQTIYKHLNDYATHPQYLHQNEQFRFMSAKVLARVFQYAVNGDMAAAKLYLNVMGNLNGQFSNNTLIQTQNNYIQINGITLSQDQVKNLNPDQLAAIETILKTAILTKNDSEIVTNPNVETT